MERLELEVSHHPILIIENASGDLRIKGWDRREIRVDAEGKNSLTADQDGDKVTLKCHRDSYVRLPMGTKLEINNIAAEASIKSVEGEISIRNIGSDLSLKDVGPTQIEHIGGQLIARQIHGDLQVDMVGGNADIRNVEGKVNVEVGGNFMMRDEIGGANVEVGGNATVRLEATVKGSYYVKAGGIVNCKIADNASAHIILKSKAKSIRIKISDFSDMLEKEEHEFTLGSGDAEITLEAHGSIQFRSYGEVEGIDIGFDFDLADEISGMAGEITENVTERIELQMESLHEQLGKLSLGALSSGSAKAKATARRVERKVEAAQRRIERHMEAAAKRAERRTRRGRSRTHSRKGRVFTFGSGAKQSDPVSDEERRMILEMVQNSQITVEEAENLLRSLEGTSEAQSTKSQPVAPIPPTPPVPPEAPKPPKTVKAQKELKQAKTKEAKDSKTKSKSKSKSKRKTISDVKKKGN